MRLGYRPALDGLRALAVLAVITMHAWHDLLPGGWIGVDLFFVLSGFLITSILLAEQRETGEVSLARFYARRALRLLPALALLVPVSLAAAVLLEPSMLSGTLHEAMASALYVSNWLIAGESAHHTDGLLGHTWSLAIEEQFYLIWPIMLCALLRLGGVRWTLRAVLVGIAGLVVYRAMSWPRLGGDVYFRTDTRADALLIGAAVALAYANGIRPSPRLAVVWSGLGAMFCLWLATRYDILVVGDRELALGGFTIIAVAGAGLVIAAMELPLPPLSWSPVVAIGRISYGLYLYHYPIVKLVLARTGNGAVCLGLTVLLTFAVAALSYRYLERPFLRLKPRAATPRPAAAPGSVPLAA